MKPFFGPLLILSLMSQAFAAPKCDELLNAHGSNLISQGVSSRVSIATPSRQEILSKVATWKKRLAAAESVSKSYRVLGEISEFAATLIKGHKNQEFFFLASQMDFPINKYGFEDYDADFFYYGVSLLEVAVFSKNYEVYGRLSALARDYNWPKDQSVYLNTWSQPLARVMAEDPVFSKDLLTTKTRNQDQYHPRIKDFGYLTPKTIERIEEAINSNNYVNLHEALANIFPSGSLRVEMEDKTGKSVSAILEFIHNGYEQEKKPWLHLQILDSRLYFEGIFSSGYKKYAKFNLQTTDYDGGRYTPLNGTKENWVKQFQKTKNSIRIVLERDKLGRFYDRGTKYQELIMIADESGRIKEVTIRNGDNELFQRFWFTQTVRIPQKTKSFSNVSFAGEEDLSTTDIGK